MKIGLEAPNGFPSHFAPQPHKYLEQPSSSTNKLMQISNTLGGSSSLTPMSIMKAQLSRLLAKISLLLEETLGYPKDTVLSLVIKAS